jgi:hypothetical protein
MAGFGKILLKSLQEIKAYPLLDAEQVREFEEPNDSHIISTSVSTFLRNLLDREYPNNRKCTSASNQKRHSRRSTAKATMDLLRVDLELIFYHPTAGIRGCWHLSTDILKSDTPLLKALC